MTNLIVDHIELGAIEISGEVAGFSSVNNQIALGAIEITGGFVGGELIEGDYVELSPIVITGVPVFQNIKSNWVAGSKIGRLDFTLDEAHDSFERPMDWKGWVYDIIKLGKSAIVYGENGITQLIPSEVFWGMKTIHRIGIKNKGAAAGDDSIHFFIDNNDKLYSLTSEGINLLDYSEYLSNLTSPILSLDVDSNLLYICDGTTGYVYSILTKSFAEGPAIITGIRSQSGTLYVTASDVIEMPALEITTDIYDFGSRFPKTILNVEVGTDLTERLFLAIEFRNSNRDEFASTDWALVNPDGVAHLPCYGTEFRIKLKSEIYEYLEIDYLKVNGVVHQYNYLNSVQ
jgi:hypothetical protein